MSLRKRSADDERFHVFATRSNPSLTRLAYLLCGDQHLANDLVQTCLIRVYQASSRVRDKDAADAYARKVLLRCWLNERRRPWRRSELRDGVVPDQPALDPDLVEVAHHKEVLRHALAAPAAPTRRGGAPLLVTALRDRDGRHPAVLGREREEPVGAGPGRPARRHGPTGRGRARGAEPMKDYDVPAGLAQLAEEADPAPIDTHDVIAKARTRTRNRRASTAAAFGTVALVGATAFTLGFPNADKGDTRVGTPTSAANEDCPPGSGSKCTSPPVDDDHSAALDSQLAAALDSLTPAGFTFEKDPFKTGETLKFTGAPNASGTMVYSASAWLRDSQGPSAFTIYVLKRPAGTPLGHADGQFFGPCTAGESHCEVRTLDDGTQATARENAQPPALQLASTLSAQRPDGTYIQVISSVGLGPVPSETPRPIPALTNADLFEFATVFTLPGEPDNIDPETEHGGVEVETEGAEEARYDDQLAAAGGLPARYAVEGTGGTNPTTFQEAPDSTDTPRYLLQVNLVPSSGDGESTSFSMFVMKREDADGDPGKGGDAEDCREHPLLDGTTVAVWTEVRSDEVTTHMTAHRPDDTVVEVQHSGAPGIPLLNEDELKRLASAFTY
jgi:hypothetical protein